MTVQSLSTLRLASVQVFIAVLQFGTATEAARQIGCNQSTISRSIDQLEEFLGGKVFEGGPQLRLTPLGEAFRDNAGELMAWARKARKLKDASAEPKELKSADLAPSARPKRLFGRVVSWIIPGSDPAGR